MKLRQTRVKFIFGAHVDISSYELSKDKNYLRGLPSKLIEIGDVVIPQGIDSEGPYSEIVVPEYFPPGSVMVFETHLQDLDSDLDTFCASGVQEAMADLDLIDLNILLYRTDAEERDLTKDEFGSYEVPGLGKMVYCGLEGWIHPLGQIMRYNDLGHPLCAHLRQGTWALDYVHQRLERYAQVYRLL